MPDDQTAVIAAHNMAPGPNLATRKRHRIPGVTWPARRKSCSVLKERQ